MSLESEQRGFPDSLTGNCGMSLEDEDRRFPDKDSETTFDAPLKKPNISYSRDFLFSLSNLYICKKLPNGFDETLLSEFEDASASMPDRPRIPGNFLLQGPRRNEYVSSPPTKAIYGKWESRSSGRSDRDSDSQSEKDSDSGRRYGSQSRRSWQTPEQDGLLGSGSFAKPSAPVPKVRPNEQHQLNKSNEPYHPPRPYKAPLPYSRKDTDSLNDETFGSSEGTSGDKAEEEMRRRAEFELMRKEQLKVLQEKQKLKEKHKVGSDADLCTVLEDYKEEKDIFKDNGLDISTATSISKDDFDKSSFGSNSSATRPLVPPGFKNNILDKTSGIKSLIHPSLSEAGEPETEENLLYSEANHLHTGTTNGLERSLSQETSVVDGQPSEKARHASLLKKGENVNSYASLHVPIKKLSMGDQLNCPSSFPDSCGTLNGSEVSEHKGEVLEEKTVGDSNWSFSTSTLENVFGSTSSFNVKGPSSDERRSSKLADTWSLNYVQPSNFAQWFPEEEARTRNDIASGSANNILSLIGGGDKHRYQVSDADAVEQNSHSFSYNTLEQSNIKNTSELPPTSTGVFDQVSINNKEEAIPSVLTCEDLELTMLSEFSANTRIVQPSLKSSISADSEKPRSRIDSNASVHLLSLLQRGTDQANTTSDPGVDINLADKLFSSQEHDTSTTVDEPKGKEKIKNIPSSGKTLTLETLFGSAFMQELQSVEAPVSVQRGSNESSQVDEPDPLRLPLQFTDNDISFQIIDNFGLQGPSRTSSGLASDLRQSKAENWLNFEDPRSEITSSKHRTEPIPRRSEFEGVHGFQLTELENQIPVGDSRNHQTLAYMPIANLSSNANFSSSVPIDIMQKLATFGVVKDEQVMAGSESLAFNRGSYEEMKHEIAYCNFQGQQPPQMNQLGPSYHQVKPRPAHLSSNMKLLGPDQFSSNIGRQPFHHLNVGAAGYNDPSHHSMMHQMKMSGMSPHIKPNFIPAPHHGGNQAAGLVQEMNQMQGYHYGPRSSNIGSHGVPIPGPNFNSPGGTPPPEAFQRLMEMEQQRANSKQIHPSPGHNNNPGSYGHEVRRGFHI